MALSKQKSTMGHRLVLQLQENQLPSEMLHGNEMLHLYEDANAFRAYLRHAFEVDTSPCSF